MTEGDLKKLRRRYVWGILWALLFGITAVTILALLPEIDLWTGYVMSLSLVFRVLIGTIIIWLAIYVVRDLIFQRLRDYRDAKRRHDSERRNA